MSKKIKLTKQEKALLNAAKHSKDRTPIPRPCKFRDKTKYNRKALKSLRNFDQ